MSHFCLTDTLIRIQPAPESMKTSGYNHVIVFHVVDEFAPAAKTCEFIALTDDQLKQLAAHLVIYLSPQNV